MTNTENRKKLVEVKHLKQYFGSKKNVVKAIDDISFEIFSAIGPSSLMVSSLNCS